MTWATAVPNYYMVDFGGAVWLPADMPVTLRTATSKHWADDDMPEMSQGGTYDPFKVDIFQFGDVLIWKFVEVCFLSLLLQVLRSVPIDSLRNISGWSSWDPWSAT